MPELGAEGYLLPSLPMYTKTGVNRQTGVQQNTRFDNEELPHTAPTSARMSAPTPTPPGYMLTAAISFLLLPSSNAIKLLQWVPPWLNNHVSKSTFVTTATGLITRFPPALLSLTSLSVTIAALWNSKNRLSALNDVSMVISTNFFLIGSPRAIPSSLKE